ncbi:hypothetical protein JT26_02440 [Porphyromonas sp. COT-108 OH1349]|nr:hypothetical protein JT26_02440 [Porphyromonas sp. COT-108 OH1349]
MSFQYSSDTLLYQKNVSGMLQEWRIARKKSKTMVLRNKCNSFSPSAKPYLGTKLPGATTQR